MKKKILIAVGIVVVLVVAGVAVLVMNLDRIVAAKKDTILQRAESEIGRKVSVGEVSVALWPGIGVSLEDVTVAEDPAFGDEAFAHVADLRVNVKLMPLLRKQIEVKRLVLGGATINVIKNDAGVFNFDSMVPAGETAGGGATGGGATSGAAAVPFVLAFADIENGTVRYVDRAAGIDQTVRDIDFTASNVSLDSEVEFELAAAVGGGEQDVHVEGKAGPVGEFSTPAELSGVPVDVAVSLGPVDAKALLAAIPQKPGQKPAAFDPAAFGLGAVEAHLALRGTLGALRVEDAEAKAAVLGAGDPNVTVKATLGGINPLDSLDLAKVTVKASLETGDLPVTKLVELAPAPSAKPGAKPDRAGLTASGTVKASLDAEGSAADLGVNVSIDASRTALAVGEAFTKPEGMPLGAMLSCRVTKPSIEVVKAELRLDEFTVTGHGRVMTGEDGAMDLTFKGGETDLSGLAGLLPAAKAVSPTGKLSLEATVKGSMERGAKPEVAGTVRIAGAGATLAQLPRPVKNASATLKFTATTARVDDAVLTVGESTVRATFDATSLTPLKATYRISSDRIHRNDFQAPVGPPMPRPEVLDNVVAKGRITVSAPPESEVTQEGTVTSSKGTVANLDYTDLAASIHSEGEVIVIESFSAKTLDGTVKGNGRVNPTAVPPTFDIHTEVSQVDVAKYFQYKFPAMANVLEGRIDLTLNLAGAGREWPAIATSLSGGGGAMVVRGALLNVNLANELVSSLQSIPLVPSGLGERLRSKHPNLFSGNTTAFQNLDGKFTIDGGKIHSSDLFLKAADFSVKGEGWLSFDRTLDIRTSFIFSKSLTADIVRELPIARYLQNADGRLVLPLVLSGDVVKPRIVPDADAISASLQRGAVEEGKGKLQDQLKDRLGEGVKDLLGGLKKKKGSSAPPDTTHEDG